MEEDLIMFKADIIKRRHGDALINSELSENQDVEQNKSKEDHIINSLANLT